MLMIIETEWNVNECCIRGGLQLGINIEKSLECLINFLINCSRNLRLVRLMWILQSIYVGLGMKPNSEYS